MRKTARFFFKTHRRKTLFVFLVLFIAWWFCLPNPLFQDPTSIVIEDKDENLLGARIAKDGQWRFPYDAQIPTKFVEAITEFEDRRFFHHPGVDPRGIGRAIQQNFKSKRVVSGGSTISMQVIRMARKGKPRSLWQKVIELIMALRLELRFSKNEILAFYTSNAPFGGNVVGLDAASWRYFAKHPRFLSWGETATLAVLPNSPSLIHPGRNRAALLAKRNRLLDRLQVKGVLDELTCRLAKEESLPEKPKPLPNTAPHLLNRVNATHFQKNKEAPTRLQTTIDGHLQSAAAAVLKRHQQKLSNNGIHNMAAIIIEVESGNVVAYHGNVPGIGADYQEAVDCIRGPRSTGSILKPFLYSMALQEGTILPESILSDVPTLLSGYRPENFNQSYDGMVTAKRALVRSLNVPMIRLLQKHGLEQFHFGLNKWGLTTIKKSPTHYGLPLILGGAETTLWDITNAYACMARTLNHYSTYDSRYDPLDFRPANYFYEKETPQSDRQDRVDDAPFSAAGPLWFTFDAMQKVQRPNSEGDWEQFQSRQRIAWKTGTSFGFRDAWAVGLTPQYAIGVWAGNADGEGRPGLVGVLAAGPVLFELFDLVANRNNPTPYGDWFEEPFDDLVQIPVCRKSGFRALDICEVDSSWVPRSALKAPACAYHRQIHLDATETVQVNSDCESPSQMKHRAWFVLPPVEEHYYKSKNPNYKTLPPYRADCENQSRENPMQLIYPKANSKIYVPVGLDGELSRTVFKVAHRNPETMIHWHIDNTYLGSTEQFHNLELNPSEGAHVLTLVDALGRRLELDFEILKK